MATDTLILQPDAATGQDTPIRTGNPETNYNTSINITTGAIIANIYRSLVSYDISSIPSNATIDSATYTLYADNVNFTFPDIYIYRTTSDWEFDNCTWDDMRSNFPVLPHVGVPWLTPGGGGDFDPAIFAFIPVNVPAPGPPDDTPFSTSDAGLVALIQNAVTAGESTVNWLLKASNAIEIGGGLDLGTYFSSNELVNTRPRLEITYTYPDPIPPGPTPTPIIIITNNHPMGIYTIAMNPYYTEDTSNNIFSGIYRLQVAIDNINHFSNIDVSTSNIDINSLKMMIGGIPLTLQESEGYYCLQCLNIDSSHILETDMTDREEREKALHNWQGTMILGSKTDLSTTQNEIDINYMSNLNALEVDYYNLGSVSNINYPDEISIFPFDFHGFRLLTDIYNSLIISEYDIDIDNVDEISYLMMGNPLMAARVGNNWYLCIYKFREV